LQIDTKIVALHLSTQSNTNDMPELLVNLPSTEKIFLKSKGLDSERYSYNTELFTKIFEDASKVLQLVKPNAVVVLGDRLETLGFALASFLLRIKVCHLHGGEVSKGSLDDIFRNQISAMASLHFPATRDAEERLIQIGFASESIYCHGALAVDTITQVIKSGDGEFLQELRLAPFEYILCTYHPATQLKDNGLSEVIELLSMLEQIGLPVVFTRVNTETGSEKIETEILKFVQRDRKSRFYLGNLGSYRYINLLRTCKFVIGNSSSGIFEAPILGVPSVDFGKRQMGRWRPSSVMKVERQSDLYAFIRLLEGKPRNVPTRAYGDPGVAKKILETIMANNE